MVEGSGTWPTVMVPAVTKFALTPGLRVMLLTGVSKTKPMKSEADEGAQLVEVLSPKRMSMESGTKFPGRSVMKKFPPTAVMFPLVRLKTSELLESLTESHLVPPFTTVQSSSEVGWGLALKLIPLPLKFWGAAVTPLLVLVMPPKFSV